MKKISFIKFFKELNILDVPSVGGKNASLGEMYSRLASKVVSVPNGYATTSEAYRYFLESTGLKDRIKDVLKDLNTKDVRSLIKKGALIRKMILEVELPDDFKKAILIAYHKLSAEYKVKNLDVAVRSSATAEDLPDASFAGQQESFLNVVGDKALLAAVKACIASLFNDRAISYRVDKGFDHFSIALSVGVQKMVRSDLGSSGVMFTIDTESGFKNAVLINSIYGLGENMVQGRVNPDEFYVFKPTMAIISRSLGKKALRMIYDPKGKTAVKNIPVSAVEQLKPSITDEQVKQLAKWAILIEEHYKRPMDIEWGYDGKLKKLFILQARPETVESVKDRNFLERYVISQKGKLVVSGQSVGNRIGEGIANRIMSIKDINDFKRFVL